MRLDETLTKYRKSLLKKVILFQGEPEGEHSPDSRYGLRINGDIPPGFENLINGLAVVEDDKNTPIFGDTTPPPSPTPRADQAISPYDSQPRQPLFLSRFGRIWFSFKHTASSYNNDLTRDINGVLLITDLAQNL